MALKVLLLRKKLTDLQTALADLERTSEDFTVREAELAADIEAAQTQEERSAVEEAVAAFEQERSQNAEAIQTMRTDIAAAQEEIRQAEQTAQQARSGNPGSAGNNRKDDHTMENEQTRTRFFGMTVRQRDDFLAREDVTTFLARVRELKGQNRSVSGAELGIPEVMLGVIRDNLNKYSKLLSRVSVRSVSGKARQNVAGTVPEGVWTEAVASLNELDISFTQVELDGYKVGGYLVVPNSIMEDASDLNLASEVMTMLAQALGYALDKAIVYGNGSKMPVGWVTRLAASVQPAWWGTNQGDFTNLSASNVRTINVADKIGTAFFQPLMTELSIADPKYSSGALTWVMNRKTHMDLLSRCMEFNASASLVAGMQNTMPVIGGDIIELDFIPDNVITGGFASLYLLAERSGANIRSSDIPMMVQDQTVFVATQRWDGKPVRGEGFVMVSYDNSAAPTSEDFAEDYANEDLDVLTVTSVAGSSSAGTTAVTIAGNTPDAVIKYKVGAQPVAVAAGKRPGSAWSTYAAGTDITAATGSYITAVELDAAGKIVKAGSASVTAKA